MITFNAQHILNPAAKKRIFLRNFNPQLYLQIIQATIIAANNSQEPRPI